MDFLNDKQVDEILKGIYEGQITVDNLPLNVYEETVDKLMEGIEIGIKHGKISKQLKRELQENIFAFSGAKTYQQVRELTDLIVNKNEIRSFSEFKKLALQKFEDYNVSYLEAEYNTAIGQAQTAQKWEQIQREKETFPYLKRTAVMDANTSEECRKLNDIIAPVDDPFWRTRSPLTHFNCRCLLEQIDKYEDVKLSSQKKIDKAIKETEHINPLFKGNPGIDKVIFNESHPYFDIAPKDKELAKKNFNLPTK